MKTFCANIPTSLGDIINIKNSLDKVKDQFSEINISYHRALWKDCLTLDNEKEQQWNKYLNDLAELFFSQPPYKYHPSGNFKFYGFPELITMLGIKPIRPNLSHLLSKGHSICQEPYIIFTTKVRGVHKRNFLPKPIDLWQALKNSKYKIIILGEREVEMRKEYLVPELYGTIYGLYEQIACNVSEDQVIDLTIPALGNTQSTLSQIQQDCFIMNQAKAVIVIGVGGNLNMADAAGANVIHYREDNFPLCQQMYPAYTRDWYHFINQIEEL